LNLAPRKIQTLPLHLTPQTCGADTHYWLPNRDTWTLRRCKCQRLLLCPHCARVVKVDALCECRYRTGETFRERWQYHTQTDPGLTLFTASLKASGLDIPKGARVLEIGCAEADWLSLAQGADPTLDLYGIDWRACDRPGRIAKGNVLTFDYPPESFDVLVSISAIEHMGLGHYDADPANPDGDIETMQNARDWLKPGGLMYFDVPFGERFFVHGTSYRVYDEAALDDRLLVDGLEVIAKHYAPKNNPGLLSEVPLQGQTHDQFAQYVAVWLQRC
jgi:hypothetical protein